MHEIEPERAFIVSVDLGQAQDPTALTVVERLTPRMRGQRPEHDADGMQTGVRPVTERGDARYHLRHVDRLELGTSYPDVATRIRHVMSAPQVREHGTPELVVDATGVGRPVVDMLREAGLSPWSIFITGGDAVTRDGREYRVPKRELASQAQALLQSGRVKFAEGIAHAETLRTELQTFKAKINLDTGSASFEHWRESDTDDIVLALAMAVWFGEHHRSAGVVFV